MDPRVWRVVGDPLVAGMLDGPLSGQRVAVKDVYAVRGYQLGGGNPEWLAHAGVEQAHAAAVDALLTAGADVAGIARTDEFAYSLAGTNRHTGTPPNPRAPHRVPGGSSSGPASAVSLGQATIGLGSDTGGSVRVPASYQGLYGIRTTHGAISCRGMLELSPSFDTVGWLARDADTLAAVGDVLLPRADRAGSPELVLVPTLVDLAWPDVAAAVRAFARNAGATEEERPVEPDEWVTAFTTLQGWEAWRQRGGWLRGRLDSLGPGVRGRFEAASRISDDAAARARERAAGFADAIRHLVADQVLVLPSAASVPPLLDGDHVSLRRPTMQLTCIAGLAGLPAVSVPLATADGLPCGVSLVAAAGRDRDLLELAAHLI
jgi:Asp-tRNA(Asn)/Glu-tRNA(Gln) amidotransferase A subunit family amidase